MKRISIIISMLLCISAVASAQHRAAGLRIGTTGLDASYQYSMNRNTFLQGDLGMDFGSSADAAVGFKVTGTYNMIWARPAWTDMGTWAIYAGPGVSLGYVGDKVTYKNEMVKVKTRDHGFMFAIAAQAGIEYNFEFPLQLAADIRPYIGLHVGQKAGFYDRGLLGLIPTLSARYRF
jgi:opacity protein-like surface antigen